MIIYRKDAKSAKVKHDNKEAKRHDNIGSHAWGRQIYRGMQFGKLRVLCVFAVRIAFLWGVDTDGRFTWITSRSNFTAIS